MNKEGQAGQSSFPFVSVIVPVYNGQSTIAACVESILAQDYPKDLYEIIIVDNNSTDDTSEVVQRYPVRLVYQRKLQTPSATRNLGIQVAKANFFAFIDADCIASPTWLRSLLPPLFDPDVGAVSGCTLAHQPVSLVQHFFSERNLLLVDDRELYIALLTCNMACRRNVVDQVGLFDEYLPTIEDLDWGWRLQSGAGKRIVFASEAVVHHQYRSSVKGLFHAYRRYGLSEILVDTLFRGKEFSPRTPRQQLFSMLHQVKAVIIYILAFLRRCLTWPVQRYSRKVLLWPLLLLIAESGDLLGKIQGLISTRFFRRNPFVSKSDVRPSQSKALYHR